MPFEGTLPAPASGALDVATVQMAQSPGFKDALCHCAN
jgi:hypothetical protein